MNGHWNGYCAFNRNGSRRDVEPLDPAWFRKAFARMYLVVHGGGDVNRRGSRRLGLPPVAGLGLEYENPLSRASVIWNPQGYGSPDVPGNSAQAYYPGDAYVDVVGNDLYDIRGKVEWAANDRLYRAHPSKPGRPSLTASVGPRRPVLRPADGRLRPVGQRRVELISYYSVLAPARCSTCAPSRRAAPPTARRSRRWADGVPAGSAAVRTSISRGVADMVARVSRVAGRPALDSGLFEPRPAPWELVENAIRAAGTAPSGAHQQPWTFVRGL